MATHFLDVVLQPCNLYFECHVQNPCIARQRLSGFKLSIIMFPDRKTCRYDSIPLQWISLAPNDKY